VYYQVGPDHLHIGYSGWRSWGSRYAVYNQILEKETIVAKKKKEKKKKEKKKGKGKNKKKK
jgi:hypothetical protein